MMLDMPRWHLLKEGCGRDVVNIFFAGAGFTYDLIYNVGVRKRLLSWFVNPKEEIEDYINAQKDGRESFSILDSGAFTVWNKGSEIKVTDYADKLIELLQWFDVAANLDVIPGTRKMAVKDITPEMNEQAAQAGWQNYEYLKGRLAAAGINQSRVMPIYHQGESIDWLKKMVDSGCEYIGISPSNACATPQRQLWLDDVFDYLRSLPKLPRTHGYAVTSVRLMAQYPWFSVDSASWVQQGGYGVVSTPFGTVTLTDRKSIIGKVQAIEGSGWCDEMRNRLAEYLKSIGLTIDELKTDYKQRWVANAIHTMRLESQTTYLPRPRPRHVFESPITKKVVEAAIRQDCFGLTVDGLPPRGDSPMHLYDVRNV